MTETYECTVCGNTFEQEDGSDFPYWPHETHCAGPDNEADGVCFCDLNICSDECDEKGLKAGDFHYPQEGS